MLDLAPSNRRTDGTAAELIDRLTGTLRGQDFSRLDALADEATTAAAASGDEALHAAAAECRAQADYHLGRHPSSLLAFADAIRRWDGLGDCTAEARSRIGRANVLSVCGLPSEALDDAHAALALLDGSTDFGVSLSVLLGLGRVQATLRAWDEADAIYARALAAARARGGDGDIGRVLADLGFYYGERSYDARSMGDTAGVREFATKSEAFNREALERCRATGESKLEWIASMNRGEALLDLGRHADAQRSLEDVLDSIRQSGAPSAYAEAEALYILARIALAEHDHASAVDQVAGALDLAVRHGLNELTMRCHELFAIVHEAAGDYRAALAQHRKFFAVHREIGLAAARLSSSVQAAQRDAAEARAAVVSERQRSQGLELDNRTLQRESLEDSLTGLPNHRAFRRAFDRFVGTFAATGDGFYLALIDADDFKRVNDRFSHSTGDEVLRRVAGVLQQERRKHDVVARYGGEEFTLMLAHCERAIAVAVCERIRRAIEAHPWNTLAEALRMTVSIGVAGSREHADPSLMFASADRRLYRAKQAGKNCVVSTDD